MKPRCRWCSRERLALPSGILICPKCDYAISMYDGTRSSIPNRPVRHDAA